MSTQTDYFTAVIDITEVTSTKIAGSYRGGRQEPESIERGTRDITHIVVRAESLEKLQAKVTAHVALIEN